MINLLTILPKWLTGLYKMSQVYKVCVNVFNLLLQNSKKEIISTETKYVGAYILNDGSIMKCADLHHTSDPMY